MTYKACAAMLLALGFSIKPAAAIEDPFSHVKCKKGTTRTLSKWQSLNDWHPMPSTTPGIKIFRSPTETIGRWVQATVVEGTGTELKSLGAQKEETVAFNRRCVSITDQATVKEQSPKEKAQLPYFTDEQLAELVKSGKSGVVYFWSPYMPISIEAFSQAKKAADNLHMLFIPVIASKDQAKDAIDEAERLSMSPAQMFIQDSRELSFRNMSLHFPSLLMFANGKILSRVYRGYEDAEIYQKYFADYMKNSNLD